MVLTGLPMNYRRRLIAAMWLAAAAAILPFMFLTIDSKHLTTLEILAHVSPRGLSVKLGNSGSCGQWLDGIYARHGWRSFEAVSGGILLPLCLASMAIYLFASVHKARG